MEAGEPSKQFADPASFPFDSVQDLFLLDPLDFDGVDEDGKKLERKVRFGDIFTRDDGFRTIVIFGRNLL